MLSWRMLTSRSFTGIEPWTPRIAVRWNPVGMEPSRYCLRITCTSPTGCSPCSSEMPMAMSRASGSISKGGASSIS